MPSGLTLDPERQWKAREYARRRRRLWLLDLSLSGVVTLAWLVFGWSAALKGWLLTLTRNDWLLVAAFGAIFYLSFAVLELPLEYYSGFVLPHRYDQSTQTPSGWAQDQLLGLLLTAVIGLPLLEGVYWLLRVTGPLWWMWAAAGYVLVAVVLSALAPVIIMPLFNKRVTQLFSSSPAQRTYNPASVSRPRRAAVGPASRRSQSPTAVERSWPGLTAGGFLARSA